MEKEVEIGVMPCSHKARNIWATRSWKRGKEGFSPEDFAVIVAPQSIWFRLLSFRTVREDFCCFKSPEWFFSIPQKLHGTYLPPKNYLLIWNPNLAGHSAFLFAKSGNFTLILRICENEELAGNDRESLPSKNWHQFFF